jgi:7-keto-8-aminopelargonate synthetase-like enzyme
LEKVSSALLQADDAGPLSATVLTYVTRRDYFPSGNSVARFVHNVLINVLAGTLGKALGSYGAFVCCDAATADVLVNRARTLIYSTALPPPSIGAALKALELLPERVPRLHANARTLRGALNLPISDMPIVPLVFGSPEAALERSAAALEHGIFAQAIRPPTVPEGTSRLRLVATAGHDPADLERAGQVIYENVMNETRYAVP